MMTLNRFRSLCSNSSYLNALRSASTATKTDSDIELLSKQDPQISVTSGITVASIENYSPLSQVSVIVKAGSRFEKPENEGVSHLLRNSCVLSTKNNSSFMITRSLEMLGAKLNATSSREHIIYSLVCPRDNTDSALEILADVVTNPAFKHHEVEAIIPELHTDLAIHNSKPECLLLEALHKAAFRGGLRNSLFTPSYMIGKHSPEMLTAYVNENYSPPRTSVIGLGVPHADLQDSVNKLFEMNSSASKSGSASKFAAGEVRVSADLPTVHAAIVAEGASLTNTKEMLALSLLQCMLGHGSKVSVLGEAAAKVTNNPFHVSGLSLNYSDTGVFGIYIEALPNDMKGLAKAVVSAMRDLPKSISDKAVAVAKHKLKAKLMLERESSDELLSGLINDLNVYGKILDTNDVLKSVDELTASDISAVASKVVKSKPAMAAIGHLHATPFLDELL